jgi:hypothetical protein
MTNGKRTKAAEYAALQTLARVSCALLFMCIFAGGLLVQGLPGECVGSGLPGLGGVRENDAECNSAIRQIENLRYSTEKTPERKRGPDPVNNGVK